jgi:hypothetical protein
MTIQRPFGLTREARRVDAFLDGASRLPLMMYGVLFLGVGLLMYCVGVLMGLPRLLFGLNEMLLPLNEWIVWNSGIPLMTGILLGAADLLILFPRKRRFDALRCDPPRSDKVTVALTAYNDEDSIAAAVMDFRAHPRVASVIVVSNNSRDATFDRAAAAGALTFNEERAGYGHCVYRCLSEAVRLGESDIIVLCEGDRTFRAYDIDKLLAYAPHADIVNGTRTVEPLRQYHTQLSTFMYYGNLFAGKLLEAKHLGRCTFTDVGTTYKLARRSALETLLPKLQPALNLEFNAYFLDRALGQDLAVIECPITFHPRVGVSKGGNVNNVRALRVGGRMIFGMVFGWRFLGG